MPGQAGSSDLYLKDFAAVIGATRSTYVVWTFQLATVGTLGVASRLEGVVRTTLVAPRLRYLLLWNSHSFNLSFCAAFAIPLTS